MHKIVVDVQTGEVTEVPLTPEEQAAYDVEPTPAPTPEPLPDTIDGSAA